jgi:hypothetical protein
MTQSLNSLHAKVLEGAKGCNPSTSTSQPTASTMPPLLHAFLPLAWASITLAVLNSALLVEAKPLWPPPAPKGEWCV